MTQDQLLCSLNCQIAILVNIFRASDVVTWSDRLRYYCDLSVFFYQSCVLGDDHSNDTKNYLTENDNSDRKQNTCRLKQSSWSEAGQDRAKQKVERLLTYDDKFEKTGTTSDQFCLIERAYDK